MRDLNELPSFPEAVEPPKAQPSETVRGGSGVDWGKPGAESSVNVYGWGDAQHYTGNGKQSRPLNAPPGGTVIIRRHEPASTDAVAPVNNRVLSARAPARDCPVCHSTPHYCNEGPDRWRIACGCQETGIHEDTQQAVYAWNMGRVAAR